MSNSYLNSSNLTINNATEFEVILDSLKNKPKPLFDFIINISHESLAKFYFTKQIEVNKLLCIVNNVIEEWKDNEYTWLIIDLFLILGKTHKFKFTHKMLLKKEK